VPVTVAYQGEPGAYSEQAARRAFGTDARPVPLASLEDVFRALASGKVDRAVAAIENSQAGSILRTYDLLRQFDVHIVGDVEVVVDHCLLALPGESLASVKRVHSHPSALEQCAAFLDKIGAEAVAHADTAGSARMIAEGKVRGEGALAGRACAELYGLVVLAENVQTIPDNRTRFVALSRESVARQAGAQRTSIVMVTDHRPGALYGALGCFAKRGVNLLKLESRPSRGRPWEYVFYIDVEGHRDDAPVRDALAELGGLASVVRVLGSYARRVE
jgi:prephenate dehydratase/chorismate mutase/prephenate dehydratase